MSVSSPLRRFQKTGVTASILDAYRLPQLAQGWEWGMLRFLRARVTSKCHLAHPWQPWLSAHDCLDGIALESPLVMQACAGTPPCVEE